MNIFRQTDIKISYECWFTLDFRKLMAKNVKFWQIPRLFRSNLQIPRKIVNTAENTKIRDFLRNHGILEGLAGKHILWCYFWFSDSEIGCRTSDTHLFHEIEPVS